MAPGGALLAATWFPILLGAGGATSETGMTKVHVDVRAPAECTSRADLVARIGARSSRIQVVDEAPLSAQLTLSEPRAGNVLAEIVLGPTDGKAAPRRVTARTCAEAVDAAALIIAVTLDPTLMRKPAGAPARETGAGADVTSTTIAVSETRQSGAVPAAGATVASPGLDGKAAPKPDQTKPSSAATAAVETASPARPPAVYDVVATLGGLAIFGPAPSAMPGVSLAVLVGGEGDGVWAPALIVSALHAARSNVPASVGTALFALEAGTVDGCPVRWRWSVLVARPCAALLVGLMRTRGAGAVDGAADYARPFAVLGGEAIVSARLGNWIEIGARVGTGATLIRDSYGFRPTVFHRASLLTTSAGLGLGVRWP